MVPLRIEPFKLEISQAEQRLLRKKLELTRLPPGNAQWRDDNGITMSFIKDIVKYWLEEYDWESEQQKINNLPQFKAQIVLNDFGPFDIHFVHCLARDEAHKPIPLLFMHGWPGNFTEVSKIIGPLTTAGYHVIAPSLPGFGFSSYTEKDGFKNWDSARLMHQLMEGLGYEEYVVAGGDWGAMIATSMARLYPENIKAIHLTNVFVLPPKNRTELNYSEFELNSLQIMNWFAKSQNAYGQIQKTKPHTLGFAMHDSPVGMLAWMADKLILWSDDYLWTNDEIITWTLLHYFPGPMTAFQMYRENLPIFEAGELPPNITSKYVRVPTGVSAFAKDVYIVPRSWANGDFNIVSWEEQPKGGHFPSYERPNELFADMDRLFRSCWDPQLERRCG